MLKALKAVINEVRKNDQRSLALELAMESCGQLGQLVRTIGVGPTLLLVKAFAGKSLKIPDLEQFSSTLEAAAAAVEGDGVPPVMMRKRYSKEVVARASQLRTQLKEVELARIALVQKMDARDTD